MAQLKEKKRKPVKLVGGKTYKSKTGENIQIVGSPRFGWVKFINGEGKLELMTIDLLEWRLGYGLTSASYE